MEKDLLPLERFRVTNREKNLKMAPSYVHKANWELRTGLRKKKVHPAPSGAAEGFIKSFSSRCIQIWSRFYVSASKPFDPRKKTSRKATINAESASAGHRKRRKCVKGEDEVKGGGWEAGGGMGGEKARVRKGTGIVG